MKKILVVVVITLLGYSQSIFSRNIDTLVTTQNEADTSKIYTSVEERPQFPGGDQELMRYLAMNVRYPFRGCDVEHVEGRVVLRFVVEKDGCITHPEIIRSLEDFFDAETIRVINSMPEWIPAKEKGQIVRAYVMLPIGFRIQR